MIERQYKSECQIGFCAERLGVNKKVYESESSLKRHIVSVKEPNYLRQNARVSATVRMSSDWIRCFPVRDLLVLCLLVRSLLVHYLLDRDLLVRNLLDRGLSGLVLVVTFWLVTYWFVAFWIVTYWFVTYWFVTYWFVAYWFARVHPHIGLRT